MHRDGREAGVPVDVSDAALPDGLDTLDASDRASAGSVEITDGIAVVSDAESGAAGSALLRRLDASPLAVLRRSALLHRQWGVGVAMQTTAWPCGSLIRAASAGVAFASPYHIFPAVFFFLSEPASDWGWLKSVEADAANSDSRPWLLALSCSWMVLYWNTRVSLVDRFTSLCLEP